MALTDKQLRFCEEYLIDLNATQAAIRSGYSEKTAHSIGYENLIKPDIQEHIGNLKKQISERNNITIDECVSRLASMARFDMANLYDENNNLKSIHDIPELDRMAIEGMDSEEHRQDGILVSVTKKIKMSNRRASLVELLKHLGGFEKDNDQKTPKQSLLNIDNATPEQIEALATITGIKST